MALTNEDLLAISNLLDVKLKAELDPIKRQLTRIEVDLLENNALPRLSTIESCYTSTYERYKDYAERLESLFQDMDVVKKVVAGHSEQLQELQKIS